MKNKCTCVRLPTELKLCDNCYKEAVKQILDDRNKSKIDK